jgi:transcriptional regulator with XRE-family HTH domain
MFRVRPPEVLGTAFGGRNVCGAIGLALLPFDKTIHNVSFVTSQGKTIQIMSEDKKSILTPEQCRGARAMLGLSREELAERAEVGTATLAEFEGGRRMPFTRTLRDIRRALEAAGVVFLPGNGHQPGVALAREDATNGKGHASTSAKLPAKKPRGEDAIAAQAA